MGFSITIYFMILLPVTMVAGMSGWVWLAVRKAARAEPPTTSSS